MRVADLPVLVLQQVGAVAVQHAGLAAVQRGRVQPGLDAVAAGLDADHRHARIVEERVEQPHRVRAAADAGDERVGQPALGLLQLRARLVADHRLEVAHHRRIGVRPGDRADHVERVVDMGDPVAQRLVHRVLQGRGARMHRHDLGAEQLHAEDVGLLPLDVGRAHIDDAGQVEERAGGRGRDAVLAGAGLGDDAALAHAPRQQDLAQHVVDLVRAGVVELVALQIDLGAAEMPGQPLGEIERARPPDIMFEVIVELGLKGRVGARLAIGRLDREHQRHQGLGDKAPAIDAEMAALVGPAAETVRNLHHRPARNMHHRANQGTDKSTAATLGIPRVATARRPIRRPLCGASARRRHAVEPAADVRRRAVRSVLRRRLPGRFLR